MDHSRLLVWMDNRAESDREMTGKLCTRHADALVMPRGWTIDDRRAPVPLLFSPQQLVDTSDPSPRPSRQSTSGHIRRPKSTAASSQSLFDDTDNCDGAAANVAEVAVKVPVGDVPATDRARSIGHDGGLDDPNSEETRAMPWTPRLAAAGVQDQAPEADEAPQMGRLLGRAYGVRNPKPGTGGR